MALCYSRGHAGPRGGGVRAGARFTKMGDDPDGIRTRVAALKGLCPGPLDDGAKPRWVHGIRILGETRKGVKFAAPPRAGAETPRPRAEPSPPPYNTAVSGAIAHPMPLARKGMNPWRVRT